MKQVMALYHKDLKAELRNPQYLLSVVFFQFCLLFLFFLFQENDLKAIWWGNLFWVNLLIAAMSLVLKNFSAESSDQGMYYFQITDARTLFIAKTAYNFTLLLLVVVINYLLFTCLFASENMHLGRFLLTSIAGLFGLSLILTLIAFIAGFGINSSVLINIMVLPIIIPLMLLMIRSTVDNLLAFHANWVGDMTLIIGIDALILAMGIGLFPYLWRR